MSSEYYYNIFFSEAAVGSGSVLSIELFLGALLLTGVFAFWLAPGGLAWALSPKPQGGGGRVRATAAIPGPSGLPVVGSVMAFTGSIAHRVLAKLAESSKAKPLMAFSVGFTRFIVSSQPEIAKEILYSSAFANRPIKESAYELLFNRAMGFAPYGEYWRNLRRISATHLFSPKRIAGFGELRRSIGVHMVVEIADLMDKNGEVEVKKVLHFGSLNNVMRSVFGRRYLFPAVHNNSSKNNKNNELLTMKKELEELDELVTEGYELLGMFNWTDHFPVLGWFDLQGVRKRCKALVSKVNVFVGGIIQEHKANRRLLLEEEEESADFVDVLLDLENDNNNNLSESDMIAVLWEMIFRGTDTVAILLEWILARMIVHPNIQAKAQAEVDNVVGTKTYVSHSDLPNLPYTRGIVKETLRVHPPGPLLSWARLAVHDTCVGGHFIPAGTTAMVNMWAITHDDKVWADPSEFRPERFVQPAAAGEDFPIMGSDLRLAPFGAGRRVCPGKAMGLATVELWLALLLQSYKWVAADGASGGVDLSECLKLSMEMKSPLKCKAVPRVAV